MPDIDNLSIKISAEAQNAISSLDSLEKKLDAIAKKLSGISSGNLSTLSKGVKELAQATKELNSVKITNIGKIAGSIETLGKINTGNLSATASSVGTLANAMDTLSGVTIDSKQINEIVKSLRKMSGLDLKNVSRYLPKVAHAISSFSSISANVQPINDLAKSLQKLNKLDFGKIASELPKLSKSISKAMKELSSVPDVSDNVFKFIRTLSSLNNVSFSGAINELPNLSKKLKKAIERLSNTPDVSENIAPLIMSLSSLDNMSFGGAINELPELGKALKEVIKTLSKAPAVRNNVVRLVEALSRFNGTGRQVGSTANTISSGFNRISSSSVKLVTPIKNIEKAIKGVVRHFVSLATVIASLKKSIEIASALTEVQNVVDVTFGDMSSKVQEFADTSIESFGMSELSVKKFASQFQAMGTAMGINSGLIDKANSFLHEQDAEYIGLSDSLSDVSLNLTKLTADIASFYDVAQENVAEDLASIYTGMVAPLRQYGLDLTQANLSQWAMKNGLDANIQSMSQAEKTMLRYQYVIANTAAAHGDFARTQMTWANQIRILKQNFEQLGAVIGNVLINVLKPFVVALNTAMGYVIKFAKVVSNALGAIFGWTYEESGTGGIAQDFGVAADAADDMASGTGKAAKNIEKMQKGLRAFDELKVINLPEATEPSGGGGAGGGAGGAGAGDVGGGWKPGESIWKEYTSDIDNLKELGEYIGKTLTDAMNNIPWDKIYEKARNFGKGLADFLNGLISPELFGALGRTIAGALNTALYALNEFGTLFDWQNFGNSIASGINNFFATYDFATLGQTINVWVLGILQSLITAIRQTDWTMIGQQIGTALAEIDFSEILKSIGIAIWEAINGAIKLFVGMFDVAPFETAILGILALPALVTFGSKIVGFIVTPFLNVWNTLSPVINSLSILISGMSAPVLALAAAFAILVGGLAYVFATNEEVRQSFFDAVGVIVDSLQPAIEYVSQTVIPDLNNAWNGLIEILTPFGEFLEMVFTSIWQDMINPALTTIGTVVLPVLIETFQNLWEKILVPLGEFVGNVLTPVFQIVSDVLTMLWKNVVVPLAQAIGGIFIEAFKGVAEIINKTVIPIVKTVISVLNTLWKNVLSPIVNFLRNTFKPVFESVFKAVEGVIKSLQKAFTGLIQFITGVFTLNWSKAWEGIKNIFKGVFNGLASIVEGVINGIIGGVNGFFSNFNGIVSSVGSLIGVSISIPTIPTISIPRFAYGGFPEDGWFRASKGEYLGVFDDGTSYVANNQQVTDGIAEAVYPAVYNAVVAAMRNQGGTGNEPEIRVFIGDREITDIVIDGIDERTRRTGRTPFAMA